MVLISTFPKIPTSRVTSRLKFYIWLKSVNYKTWLVKDKDVFKARCGLCDRSFDISNMGEAALRSHMKGSKHVSKQTEMKNGTKISGFLKAKCNEAGQAPGNDAAVFNNPPVADRQVKPTGSFTEI